MAASTEPQQFGANSSAYGQALTQPEPVNHWQYFREPFAHIEFGTIATVTGYCSSSDAFLQVGPSPSNVGSDSYLYNINISSDAGSSNAMLPDGTASGSSYQNFEDSNSKYQ